MRRPLGAYLLVSESTLRTVEVNCFWPSSPATCALLVSSVDRLCDMVPDLTPEVGPDVDIALSMGCDEGTCIDDCDSGCADVDLSTGIVRDENEEGACFSRLGWPDGEAVLPPLRWEDEDIRNSLRDGEAKTAGCGSSGSACAASRFCGGWDISRTDGGGA
jgi:hypothetical protein